MQTSFIRSCTLALLMVGGCGAANPLASPQPAPVAPTTATTAATAAAAPTTAPNLVESAPNADAEVLARKAARHAQEMEALIAQRSAATAPSSTTQPAHQIPVDDSEPMQVPEGQEFGESLTASASAPVSRPSSLPACQSTSDLPEQRIAGRVRENPRDLVDQLNFQLLQFVQEKPVPDLDAAALLEPEDREVLLAVTDALSNFRNALRADRNMLRARKVAPLLEMADRLRAGGELRISNAVLCRKVDGFGVYEPIEPLRFAAGREQLAIVYCEIENFSSRLNEKQMWETRLTQETVLYTDSGLAVWQEKAKPVTDQCRNRRRDFFLVKLVKLPANLTIGRYLLKVTVIDNQSSRVAEVTIPVVVVAQP